MTRYLLSSGFAFFMLGALAPSSSHAASIVAGTTLLYGTAIQDLTLLPNTPFNPGPTPFLISGLSGVGSIALNRDAEDGTSNTISIPTLAGGMFFGTNPNLPPGTTYVFGNIPPLTGADFSGSVTNVVQNPLDPGFATGQPSSFQSGDFSFGGNNFGFEFLTGPLAGIKLFTDPTVPFSFDAKFDGLPPSPGTVLMNSGPDALNVLWFDPQLGMNIVVAQTSNRTIHLSAVPEPSSAVLLALGGAGTLWLRTALKERNPLLEV
jgi:hypothetical protein